MSKPTPCISMAKMQATVLDIDLKGVHENKELEIYIWINLNLPFKAPNILVRAEVGRCAFQSNSECIC